MRPQRPRFLVVAWKRLSTRTKLLSQVLDVKLCFFPARLPYLGAALGTVHMLLSHPPEVVLVQLPQGPLLLITLLLKRFRQYLVIADVHSGFLMRWEPKTILLNLPFIGLLKRADIVLIHNKEIRKLVPKEAMPRTLVVYDPWFVIEQRPPEEAKTGDYLVIPSSFAPDEPLLEVLSGLMDPSCGFRIYVTGDWRRQPHLRNLASPNVVFTGYLPREQYEELVKNSRLILAGTTQEYTLLMAAWEAVAYSKPLVLSETNTLREVFGNYATFYEYEKPQTILEAVKKAWSSEPNQTARGELRDLAYQSLQGLQEKLKGSKRPTQLDV